MSITVEQSASLNSFAYNRNEYVLSSSLSTYPKFKYNFNILYDTVTVSAYTAAQWQGQILTQLTVPGHEYKLGDTVFVSDNFNVDIVDVDGNNVIIGVEPYDINVTNSVTTCSRVISYTINKEPVTDLGVLDIGNTLRTFCTHKLVDTNNPYQSEEVLFQYQLVFGEEYEYIHEFEDNGFYSGSVAFTNSSLPASYTASLPFQIGDEIVIQQDLYEWDYTDNGFYSGSLAFTGSTDHYIQTGSQIYVVGQTTNPSYNGYTTTIEGTSGSLIVTSKTFLTSTPAEPGTIYTTLVPEYNDVATITNIYHDATLGIVIVTDLPYVQATPPIGGTIKWSDGSLVKQWETPTTTKQASTGKFDNQQMLAYDSEDYHLDDSVVSTRNFSTIIANQSAAYRHRVEQSTRGYLLLKPALHSDGTSNTGSLEIKYTFFDETGSDIGTGSFSGLTFDDKGIYTPYGLDQLIASTEFTSSLASYIDSVDYYSVLASNQSALTSAIEFELNTDCAGYELYHILFKDSLGSWISVPFKYKSFTSIETDTKSYYRKTGNLNATTNQVDYTTYDRGRTNIYKRYTEKIKLNSGWMTEEENVIIKDMLTSPEIYIQTPDNTLRAGQLLNTELDLAKRENVQIFNYTFDVAYSIDEMKY